MILYGHVQGYLVLMMIANGVLYGRSSQGCTLGGIQHGVCLGILISFDIRVKDLAVRLLVWLCLLFQISLRLSTLWIYPLKGLRSPGLWEELTRMNSRWNTAWCVFGDFNIIRYPSKRFGCEAFSLAMFAYSDFIETNYLVDLPLEGALLTWFRDSRTDCMSRIDRTLALVD